MRFTYAVYISAIGIEDSSGLPHVADEYTAHHRMTLDDFIGGHVQSLVSPVIAFWDCWHVLGCHTKLVSLLVDLSSGQIRGVEAEVPGLVPHVVGEVLMTRVRMLMAKKKNKHTGTLRSTSAKIDSMSSHWRQFDE